MLSWAAVFTRWCGAPGCFHLRALPSCTCFPDRQSKEEKLEDFTLAIKCFDPEDICIHSAYNQLTGTNCMTPPCSRRCVWRNVILSGTQMRMSLPNHWVQRVPAMELSLSQDYLLLWELVHFNSRSVLPYLCRMSPQPWPGKEKKKQLISDVLMSLGMSEAEVPTSGSMPVPSLDLSYCSDAQHCEWCS